MTDLPCLYSGPMVRAILREIASPGTGKTQTRRVMPEWPPICTSRGTPLVQCKDGVYRSPPTRYKVGDRLWVREAWRLPDCEDDISPADFVKWLIDCEMPGPNGLVRFEADGRDAWGDEYPDLPLGRVRAGMHLPRILSRITLTVTEVRVQRLQDISEADAIAEGAYKGKASGRYADNYAMMAIAGQWFASSRAWYADLWDRINGRGAWDLNPWVAAYTFTPYLTNIDAMEAVA